MADKISRIRSMVDHPAGMGGGRGGGGGDDSYSLDDGSEYSRDKFYTGSKDGGKDSISVTVNISRSLYAEIDAWVQGGKVGAYRTRQDFFRDAAYHRANDIKSILRDEAGRRALINLLANAELERRKSEMEARKHTLDLYQEALDMAWADGDLTNFGEILADAEVKVEAWPQCGTRDRLVRLIDMFRKYEP